MTEKKKFKPDDSVGYRREIIPQEEPDCPYLDRRVLGFGPGMFRRYSEDEDRSKSWFSLRLHHFFRSDEDHVHDHPTWFVTLVLAGSYEDWVECSWCQDAPLQAGRLFEVWKDLTGHTKSPFTTDRLNACLPYIKQYGVETVERAIAGIAYDPYETIQKNGSRKRFDGWELIFKNAGRFEDCACRAPRGWTPTPCGFCRGRGQVVGDYMTPGKIRFRPALHRHRVVTDGCWTLVLFGSRKRDWGFFTPDGWLRQRDYFRRYGGAAACQEVSGVHGEAGSSTWSNVATDKDFNGTG